MWTSLMPAKIRLMSQQTESFPRQSARTRHFRLGAPRQVSVSPNGHRIVFVRSNSGGDAVNRLVVADLEGASLVERVVAEPALLLAGHGEHLSAVERARRERMRETTSGITAYSLDSAASRAAFALSGRLFVVDLAPQSGPPREMPVAGSIVDPRLSPDGRQIAYVRDRALYVANLATGEEQLLAAPDSETVTWGLADFIAAEELDRHRGHWWSPDSSTLLAERFDTRLVSRWWISDPAAPSVEPVAIAYPSAGTTNAEVGLFLINVSEAAQLGEQLSEVVWDAVSYPYLAGVSWSEFGPPLLTVLSRDQMNGQVLMVDPEAGSTDERAALSDECWVDVIPGLPCWTADGRLARAVDDAATDTRRLVFDDTFVTPADAQVMAAGISDARGLTVTLAADSTERTPWRVGLNGSLVPLTFEAGVHAASSGGDTSVVASTTLDSTTTRWVVWHTGREAGELVSHAEQPALTPRVRLMRAGDRGIATAVLLPTGHVSGSARLPVLMAPYGGPHHSEVLASGLAFADDQWLADQGFAVIVADGRGTPGRGPAWERAIFRDFVGPVLDDQIAALEAVAAMYPDDVDSSRVGITGWSFGGWLAAYAVLARPDIFSVAVAGAPVTDWHLYDTAYTERYLGHPDAEPATYERHSLVGLSPALQRPLMLVHGMADDNVVVANTLALSGALLATGHPHTVLPLTGVTHMATDEVVAENLLLLQVEFLRRGLEVGR